MEFERPFWIALLHREKGGIANCKTRGGKGSKIMAIAEAFGIPVADHTERASPHEVKLIDETVDTAGKLSGS